MSAQWFDPISQRMRRMPADRKPVEIHEVAENQLDVVKRQVRQNHIWRAVVATSSSTMAPPAEEEEICF